jgi:4-amino-4-deoxy-L-arabinose transferase-like glycosyltransferase
VPPVATIDSPLRRGVAEAVAPGADSAPSRREASEGRGPGLELVFTVLFVLAGWWVGIRQLSDNSFFWHLRTGRYILDHGIPHGDVFSYTAPGAHWVAQSWLAELAYGVLDRSFGAFAIRVLVALTGAAITLLSYRLARRLAGDRVRAALVALVAFLATFVVFSERPLAFGLLSALVVVWIVEVPDARIARRPLVALPIVFWVWANVHGSFALGVVYIGLHVLGRAIDGEMPWRGRERDLVAGTFLGLVVSLANPYGPGLLLFPVQLMGRGQVLSQVVEWRSPDFRSSVGMAFAAWLVVLIGALALSSRRPTRRDVLVALPFVLLALWAERNIGLAVLFTLPIAARAVATPRDRADSRTPASAIALLVVVSLFAVSGVDAARQPDFQVGSYPAEAMSYVQAHGLLGTRLFTTDAWAGYTILRFWPQQRVFLDDRYDMYPKRLVDDYIDVADGHPGWQRVLDRNHVQVVVWQPKRALSQLLAESPQWRRVHTDANAVVFVRAHAAT